MIPKVWVCFCCLDPLLVELFILSIHTSICFPFAEWTGRTANINNDTVVCKICNTCITDYRCIIIVMYIYIQKYTEIDLGTQAHVCTLLLPIQKRTCAQEPTYKHRPTFAHHRMTTCTNKHGDRVRQRYLLHIPVVHTCCTYLLHIPAAHSATEFNSKHNAGRHITHKFKR